MAEPVNWGIILIPAVIGGIISVIINGMSKMSKTADSALTGTVKLDEITKRLEGVESILVKQGEKLENLLSEIKLHAYRLDKLNHNNSQ